MVGHHILGHLDPHQIERAGQLVPEVDHRRRPPSPDVVALLVEDRGAVVERVERLRQREGVFRQDRELQRADDLLDDLVEPGGLEHQRPELVLPFSPVELAGRDVPSGASSAASSRPSRCCSFWKMLLARTTAYWMYGPLSPSKLSASSRSKAITLPRENLIMK